MSVKHTETSLAELRQGRPTAKDAKLAEIGAACEAAIFAGVDVGGKHYALALNDQTNIGNLALQAQAGASVLYHADGELCRVYEPQEILAVVGAAIAHKTYHTTRCNHVNVWVRRTEDGAELAKIHYDSDLPKDLADSMTTLLGAGGDGGGNG